MFKKLNKKGFTLAELLIVVAIIGVLVAISIPIFTGQLEKARLATNQANARSAYAGATAEYLGQTATEAKGGTYEYLVKEGKGTFKPSDEKSTATNLDITSWKPSDNKGVDLGKTVAAKWTVVLNNDGGLVSITGASS